MGREPTYQELKQKVSKLEERFTNLKLSDGLTDKTSKWWSKILDEIPDFVSLHDIDYRFVKVNKALADFLGVKPEELIGKPCYTFLHGTDKPPANCPHTKALELTQAVTEEIKGPHGCQWLVSTTPVFSDNGELTGSIHIVKDITEHKRIEEELKRTTEQLSLILDTLPVVVYTCRSERDFSATYISESVKVVTGYEPEDFTSISSFWADRIHPADKPKIFEYLQEIFEKDYHEHNYRWRVADGSYKWFGEMLRLVKTPDEKSSHIVGVMYDITERKRIEEEIKTRQKEIEELNATLENRIHEEVEKSRQKDFIMIHQARLAAMGEMIGYIAHQWKQPLNALNIIMFNIKDSLNDLELNKEMLYTLIPTGEKLIEKMSKTIDDFRNFFKPDKQKETFSLNKSIKDTLSIVAADFKYHNISVSMNEGEEITILGFPNEYSQVILNIISNAMDAIIAKGIGGEIRIDLFSEDDFAIIGIKDNAGGISEEIINRIFDPYFTTKEENKGTGIGLYMSKLIIEDHMGGRIDVQNIDNGAEFRIIIPMIQS